MKLLQVSIQLITTGEAGYQPTGEADYQYAEVDSKPTHEQSAYHNYHTLEPNSASQENQPQYEVPVPQQHNVHKSNEVGKICKDYETFHNQWSNTFLYVEICNMLQLGALRSDRGMLVSSVFNFWNLIVAVSDC